MQEYAILRSNAATAKNKCGALASLTPLSAIGTPSAPLGREALGGQRGCCGGPTRGEVEGADGSEPEGGTRRSLGVMSS